jgi:hypothetical protein
LSDSISSPPSVIYLVGSINERYDIYMTLHPPDGKGKGISGVYAYQKVGRPIQLQSIGEQHPWSMNEFTEGELTGTFELEETDFEQIYPGMEIRGKWVHPEKTRKYPVLLEVVFRLDFCFFFVKKTNKRLLNLQKSCLFCGLNVKLYKR